MRQFVSLETMMLGTSGVLVKRGVDDKVALGVRDGSGVGVEELTISIGITAAPVCVAATIIVCMIAVPRALVSMVGPVTGMLGRPQARETTTRIVTDKRMGVDLRMMSPFG